MRIGTDKSNPRLKDIDYQAGAGRLGGTASTATPVGQQLQRGATTVQQHGQQYWRKQDGQQQAQQQVQQTGTAGSGGSYGSDQDPYVAQANALYKKLMARGPFQYDLQGDLLYRQYADQYTELGRLAMRDATGTAAGLTGGYGNSYANQVGNQAYQQYLGQLNGMIPEFYDRAYQRWQDQGTDLMTQYQLALERAAASGGGSGAGAAQASGGIPIADGGSFADFVGQMTPEQYAEALNAATPLDFDYFDQWYRRLSGQ